MHTYWTSGKGIHSNKLQSVSLIDQSYPQTLMFRTSLVNMCIDASFDHRMQKNQRGRCWKDGRIHVFLKELFRPFVSQWNVAYTSSYTLRVDMPSISESHQRFGSSLPLLTSHLASQGKWNGFLKRRAIYLSLYTRNTLCSKSMK